MCWNKHKQILSSFSSVQCYWQAPQQQQTMTYLSPMWVAFCSIQPFPAFTSWKPGRPITAAHHLNLVVFWGWNTKASIKVSQDVYVRMCRQLISYFNLCVCEEGNITTVYCHVKSNKVCEKCRVFLQAASLLTYILFFPFYFLRNVVLCYWKDKGGRRAKMARCFVNWLVWG